MRWKFIPSLFQPKNREFYSLKKIGNLQSVQKLQRNTRKKQAKDCEIFCLLQYILPKQKQDHAIPFPTILLCYGSNSVVGSYTSIISQPKPNYERLQLVPVGNFCIRFFKRFKQNLLLFCEGSSEFCFEPHNGFKQLTFVCAV